MNRIVWIDSARGIAIVLVMLGYFPMPVHPNQWVYSFHVPLFFVLSGIVTSPERLSSFHSFFVSRLRSLVIPFFAFASLRWIWFLATLDHRAATHFPATFGKTLLGTLLGLRDADWAPHLGVLWFLACLFCSELFFLCLLRLVDGQVGKAIAIAMGVSVFGSWLVGHLPKPIPWSADLALVTTGFFALGVGLRTWKLERHIQVVPWVVTLPVIGLSLALTFLQPPIDLYYRHIGIPLVYQAAAVVGTTLMIWAAPRLPWQAKIGFIGRHSLTFLVFHNWLVLPLLKRLFTASRFHWLEFRAWAWIAPVLFVGITILVLSPVALLLERHAPWLIGRSHRSRTAPPTSGIR